MPKDRKCWDVPLLNQATRKAERLLTAQLVAHEAAGLMRGHLKFAELQRLHELRKSMSVESPATSHVNVGLPPRYSTVKE